MENNENRPSLEEELAEENRKFLQELLGGKFPEPEQEATPEETVASIEDDDLFLSLIPEIPTTEPAASVEDEALFLSLVQEPDVLETEPAASAEDEDLFSLLSETEDSAFAPAIAEEAAPTLTELPENTPEATPAAVSDLDKILSEDWLAAPQADTSPAAPRQEEPPLLSDLFVAEEYLPVEESAPSLEEDPSPETVPENREPEEKKGRPKRKNGYGLFGLPHIAATLIWLALILVIGVSLGRVLWVCCADVMAFGKDPQQVTVTITEDDDINSIAAKLGDANLVRYPELFKMFVKVTGKDGRIGAGTFTLSSQLDYNAMINAMIYSSSARDVVKVMFPEGYNCAQIFKLLEEEGVCTVAELEEAVKQGFTVEEGKDAPKWDAYWFLEGVSADAPYPLEGYLAPDTYNFYKDDEPNRVIQKFLDEFESRITDKMMDNYEEVKELYAKKLRARGMSETYIKEHPLTFHQVVTLASIVQKETSSDAEGYDIASVFYNRIGSASTPNLGADATVHYALGDYFFEIKELTVTQLNYDSPYNTRFDSTDPNTGIRKYDLIPPGPICNMGVQSLYAVLEPNETRYLYFVFDPSKGVHLFAATLSEHNQNVAKVEKSNG